MNLKFLKALLCVFIIAISFTPQNELKAQRYLDGGTSFWNNVTLGGNVGATLFFGDISNGRSPYQEDWKLGYGLVLRKQFSPYFGLGFQFLNGKLHGTRLTDSGGNPMNLYFDADLMEFNIHAVLNFSNLILGYKPDRVLNLYGYVGLGIANWNSVLRDATNNDNNTNVIATSGYDNQGVAAWTPETVYPFGFGANIMLGPKLDLNLDIGMRYVNSDNLDARASGSVPNDYYAYSSIGIAYKFSGSGGLFRSGNKDKDYDREARKQAKYQDRQLRKEEKRTYRKKLEDQRLEEKRTGTRKERPKRPKRDDGMPKVVEYDAVYTQSQAVKMTTAKTTPPKTTEKVMGDTELVVDEGKHIITGSRNVITSQNNKQYIDKTVIADLTDATSSNAVITIPNNGLVYTVQILATRMQEKNIAAWRTRYNINRQVYVFKSGSLYRYSVGVFNTYEEALQYSRVLQANGLGDAFVVAYENGIRIQRRR